MVSIIAILYFLYFVSYILLLFLGIYVLLLLSGRVYSGPMLLDFGTHTISPVPYMDSGTCTSSANTYIDTNRSCSLIGHSRLPPYQEHVSHTHAVPDVSGITYTNSLSYACLCHHYCLDGWLLITFPCFYATS